MLAGDDLGMDRGWVTVVLAALYRHKAGEEARLLLRLSLELSGVHLDTWKGSKCFPCPFLCRSVEDEHEVSV